APRRKCFPQRCIPRFTTGGTHRNMAARHGTLEIYRAAVLCRPLSEAGSVCRSQKNAGLSRRSSIAGYRGRCRRHPHIGCRALAQGRRPHRCHRYLPLQTVLNTLVESAARLCEADVVVIGRPKTETYYFEASYGLSREHAEFVADHPAGIDRTTISGRVL